MSKKRKRENEAAFNAVGQSIKSFRDLAAAMNTPKPRVRFRVSLARYAVALALVGGMLTGTAIVFAMHHVYSAPMAKRL